MRLIICSFQMFKLTQEIYISDGEKIIYSESSLEEFLPKRISELCDINDINHVQLYGNQEYLTPIAEEIQTINAIKYNKNNIKVEVISNV